MTRLLTRSLTCSFLAFAAGVALLASTGCQSGGIRLFGYDQAGCCSSSCTPSCGNSASCPCGSSSAGDGGRMMVARNGSAMGDPAAADPNGNPNVMAAGYQANGCDPNAGDPNAGPGGPNGQGWPYGPRPVPRGVGGQWAGPQGPPTGGVAYPYYTNRGPRDFLDPNPPPLGP